MPLFIMTPVPFGMMPEPKPDIIVLVIETPLPSESVTHEVGRALVLCGTAGGENAGRFPALLHPGVARFDRAVQTVADGRAAQLGVIVGDEAVPGDVGERGVGEVLEAVGVGEAGARYVCVEHVGGVVRH